MEVTSLPRAAGTVRLPPRLLAPLPDDRLVAHIRRGNDAAFEVVYDRHHRGLLSFCRHMLGSQEEAEDAVQQTFVSAYRDLVGSEKPIRLKPWLYTIARNRCLSILRSRREETSELTDIPTAGLSDAVLEREELRRLLADLRELPEDQRAALVLSELGDLSHAEIADIVGCKAVQVKSLVFQARSALLASKEASQIPCHEIREQIANARGPALRRGPLRRHIRGCPACASFRDEVRRQRQLFALALPVIPSAALKGSVLSAVGIGPATAGGLAAGGAAAGGTAGSGGLAAGGAATGGGLATGVSGASGGGVLASLGAVGGAKLAVVAAVAAGVAGGGVAVKDATTSSDHSVTGSSQAPAATGAAGAGGARGWFGGIGRAFGATVANWAVSGAHGSASGSGVPWAASPSSGHGHGKDKANGNGGGKAKGNNGSAPQSYQMQNGGGGNGNAYGSHGGGPPASSGAGTGGGNAYGNGGGSGNAYGNGGGSGNAYGTTGSHGYTTHSPPPQAHGHAYGTTNDYGSAAPNDAPQPVHGNHFGSGG